VGERKRSPAGTGQAGREKKYISHRDRREHREEKMNLLKEEVELSFSVLSGSSSDLSKGSGREKRSAVKILFGQA
jgi:hypothetical protein